MDESALSYLNIQFTRSHAGRVLIASLILQRWQSQACSWLRRSFSTCTSLKTGRVGTLSHSNRQSLWGIPSVTLLCFPLHPTLEGLCCWGDAIWRQQQCLLPWLLTSPTWDRSVKSSLPKEVATPKSPSNERCTIRSRRGQNCPNSLWLRRGIFKGNIFMNQAKGKHCSPLQ